MRAAALVRIIGLAFVLASVCSAQVDERCPGTALERGPELLSSLNPLQETVRKEGYQGRLAFRLTVTETGSVRDPIVTHPTQLADSDKIKDEMLKLRFCPAVRYSRYAEVQAEFDIKLK